MILALQLYNDNKLHGEPFNFGPKNSQNKDVITLVKQMKKNWNKVTWKEANKQNQLFEAKLLKLNSLKAEKRLRWKPILNFAETVKMMRGRESQ